MDTISVFTAFLSNTTYVQRFLVLSRAYSISLSRQKVQIPYKTKRIANNYIDYEYYDNDIEMQHSDMLRLREVRDRSLSSYTAQCITLWRQ